MLNDAIVSYNLQPIISIIKYVINTTPHTLHIILPSDQASQGFPSAKKGGKGSRGGKGAKAGGGRGAKKGKADE
jgi:hypothetical protein